MPEMSSSILAAGVEDLVLVLGEVVGEDVVAKLDLAGGLGFEAGEHADEGRLARAVRADQGDAVAALDLRS